MGFRKNFQIVSFGEVLFDCFPDHKEIGGAPLNVAVRLRSFGHKVSIISAIGNDADGNLIIKYLSEKNVNTDRIAILDNFPTGIVAVNLDDAGVANYIINYPSAWDKISWSESIQETVSEAAIFIYGSLGSRDEVSSKTLDKLLELNVFKVFDINLRIPHFSKEQILKLASKANFLKCNDEEIEILTKYADLTFTSIEQSITVLSEKFNIESICVTKGKDGAVLFWKNQFYYNPGYPVKVVDTVGAGDSFLATLLHYINEVSPQQALDYSCAIGSLVSRSKGANPEISTEDLEDVIRRKSAQKM